jgi:L-asparaginase/Glu-tRNA(Gln) amidotransferase subunit D
MRLRSLAFVWLLAATTVSSAFAQALPRVHMVATGGTISNRDGGRLSRRTAQSMLGLERAATLTHEQF